MGRSCTPFFLCFLCAPPLSPGHLPLPCHPHTCREAPLVPTTRSPCRPRGCSKSKEPAPTTPRPLRSQPGPPPSTPMMSSSSRPHPAATCGVGRWVRDPAGSCCHVNMGSPQSLRADRVGQESWPTAPTCWVPNCLLAVSLPVPHDRPQILYVRSALWLYISWVPRGLCLGLSQLLSLSSAVSPTIPVRDPQPLTALL